MPTSQAKEKKPAPPTQAQALEIAKRAVAKNDTWVNRAEFEQPEWSETDQTWTVFVKRLPLQVGGDRTIVIDKSGKVIAYHRGM